ncbi:uncharacterized protein LOC120551475 [Perca fluviatilis]|uniref:uncharacterized protein LOC120551475 n=1 Tax=Perca fluviatilis TaxID=8168 RepID=UPI0019654D73|nr:uncharacterized protein LOC120551475 [Perca fluviatilis]
MENLCDVEGASVAYGVFTASTDIKDELITSLTSFLRIYSQGRDCLQRTSESFTLAVAQLHDMQEDIIKNESFQSLLSLLGGVSGAVCGGVTAGVLGALGAVNAATSPRFCGHINAVWATVGFIGSVFGGVVGGVFCGGVGGAVCAAAKVTGSPVPGVLRDVASFTIGGATGGAIGGIFGRTIGAAGGAFGCAFGTLFATRFSIFVVGNIMNHCKDSKEQKTKSKKENVMQKSRDFSESIKPLVNKLKTMKTVSNKMASDVVVHSVAAQTAKTLKSVITMVKTISDSQRTTDLPQFVSSVEDAARQGQKITEELEEMRAEVEKLLVSLSKH